MFTFNVHNQFSSTSSNSHLYRTRSVLRNRSPLLAAILLGLSASAVAAPVTIPNADFSVTADDGSVGGALLGGSSPQNIGAGPWQGTYAGILGTLLPPLLTVSSGQADISGIAIVDVLGLGNRGAFVQTLTTQWAPVKHYVLAADVSAGVTLLAADVSTNGNIGLAMSSGASTYSSSETSLNVTLSLLQSNTYHLALGFDSTASSSGDIGISLFSNPTGILAANVLSQVVFQNIRLTEAPIPALLPAAIGSAGGTPQAATVMTAFVAPLGVSVLDDEGDPLEGITVTFTAPSSGPSATLNHTTVVTDVGGRAIVLATANNIDGPYPITATIDGVQQPATFNLTNTGNGQPTLTSNAGGDQSQSAVSGNPFACELSIQVIDGASPAAGATVVFTAPASGASASLDDGTNSGATVTMTTDAQGIARVAATANATPGSYNVTSTVTSLQSGPISPQQLASYPLTNLDAADHIFADGFETIPAPCGSF